MCIQNHILGSFDLGLVEGDVSVVGSEVLAVNSSILTPFVDVSCRCFRVVVFGRERLESLLQTHLDLTQKRKATY